MSIFVLVLAVVTITGTQTTIQTDWSGGIGYDIVSEWGNEFGDAENIEWLRSDESIHLTNLERIVNGSFYQPFSVLLSDIDSDGDIDVFSNSTEGELAWWENTCGTGEEWIEHVLAFETDSYKRIAGADLDGDNDTDIVGVNEAGFIVWWNNCDGIGLEWEEYIIDESIAAHFIATVDIDNDGDSDILGTTGSSKKVFWLENCNGEGTVWLEHVIHDNFSWAHTASAHDMDTDGDLDILCAGEKISWMENTDGAGLVWEEHFAGFFDTPNAIEAADLNGDSFEDIVISGVGAAWNTGGCVWWENADGSGDNWIKHSFNEDLTYCDFLFVSDVNQDGYSDVVYSCGPMLAWWENEDNSGDNWISHTIGYGQDVSSACIGDINGDNNLDIVAGDATYGSTIRWWDIRQFVSEGFLRSSVLFHLNADWLYLDWNSTEPPGTDVSFMVTSSEAYSSFDPWSDIITAPGSLEGILNSGDHYMMYRAILSTTDPSVTPVLNDVSVDWITDTGIEGESEGRSLSSFTLSSNPISHNGALCFTIKKDSEINLRIMDISGRVISSHSGNFSSGDHEVMLTDLSNGTYIALLTSAEDSIGLRFVLLR